MYSKRPATTVTVGNVHLPVDVQNCPGAATSTAVNVEEDDSLNCPGATNIAVNVEDDSLNSQTYAIRLKNLQLQVRRLQWQVGDRFHFVVIASFIVLFSFH